MQMTAASAIQLTSVQLVSKLLQDVCLFLFALWKDFGHFVCVCGVCMYMYVYVYEFLYCTSKFSNFILKPFSFVTNYHFFFKLTTSLFSLVWNFPKIRPFIGNQISYQSSEFDLSRRTICLSGTTPLDPFTSALPLSPISLPARN